MIGTGGGKNCWSNFPSNRFVNQTTDSVVYTFRYFIFCSSFASVSQGVFRCKMHYLKSLRAKPKSQFGSLKWSPHVCRYIHIVVYLMQKQCAIKFRLPVVFSDLPPRTSRSHIWRSYARWNREILPYSRLHHALLNCNAPSASFLETEIHSKRRRIALLICIRSKMYCLLSSNYINIVWCIFFFSINKIRSN